MEPGAPRRKAPVPEVWPNGKIWLNPNFFAKRILDTSRNDFARFEVGVPLPRLRNCLKVRLALHRIRRTGARECPLEVERYDGEPVSRADLAPAALRRPLPTLSDTRQALYASGMSS